jgi:hypothetical protein
VRAPTPEGRGDRLRDLLGPALLVLALLELARESWPIPAQTDDAYISYRYARNLLAGAGLVYNAGEYVEGMTNLLWTLLVALGLAFTGEAKAVGWALGVASGAALLVLTWVYACTGLPRAQRFAGGAAAWLVLASLPFAYWTSSGMETPLFAALVTATLAADARGRPGLAVGAAFLATATRPEGALAAAAVFGWRVLRDWPAQGARALRAPAAYAVLVLALTLFRVAYYGSPVPNTFYAKVGGVPPLRGFYYVLGFWVGGPALLLVPASFALARDARAWPALAFAALLCAYVVAVGGDAFPYARFLVPLLPALAAFAVRGALAAGERGRAAGALCWGSLGAFILVSYFGRWSWEVAGCGLAVSLLAALAWSAARRRLAPLPAALAGATLALSAAGAFPTLEGHGLEGKPKGQPGRETRAASLARNHAFNAGVEALAERRARVLRERDGAPQLVATGGIGAFGWHAPVAILDLYGLVDPEIARSHARGPTLAAPGHIRSNADYVLAREPDYVLIPRRGARMIRSPSVSDLWEHPDFDARYEWDAEIVGYRRRAR